MACPFLWYMSHIWYSTHFGKTTIGSYSGAKLPVTICTPLVRDIAFVLQTMQVSEACTYSLSRSKSLYGPVGQILSAKLFVPNLFLCP